MTDMKTNAFIALGFLAIFSSTATAQDAKQILDASGLQGGLIVVIGCDSPKLLAELRAGDSYLVHGMDRDPGKVAAARSYLKEKGLYGSVTAARWDGTKLPYVDSLVNLIVLTGDTQVPVREMTRVLAPRGVVTDIGESTVKTARKDWPEELDEWTHFLYDASNNAVSNDTAVDPPRGLRWTAGPTYARSHEQSNGIGAMVTAGGRVFYIIDDGPTGSVFLPPQWKLVARDAFSGVLLWEHSIANWESHLRGFRSGPPEIGRRIVAAGDLLYATLGYTEPVTLLDAATGEPNATLAGTEGAGELLLTGGVLYVLADDMTPAQHEERREWFNRVYPTLNRWYAFPKDPIRMYGTQRVVAIDTAEGALLWERKFEDLGEVMPATMAVSDGKLCLQTVSHVVCLNASGGSELWRSQRPVATSRWSWSAPTLVVQDGVVLSADRPPQDNVGGTPPAEGSEWIVTSGGTASGSGSSQNTDGEMVAFSLDKGQELWRAPSFGGYNAPADVFVIDGVVWSGDFRKRSDPGFTEGRDLKTGKVTVTLPENMVPSGIGHHRCHRNRATVRWLLPSRSWIEFLDPRDGTHEVNTWARGACQYGIMPANGLLYVPQHSCACNPSELLVGFNALSPRSAAGEGPPPLEKGPAYTDTPTRSSGNSASEWPTYRRDAHRSGYQDLAAPANPNVLWTKQLSRPITAPVAADGLVVVAETDRHTVNALSTGDGATAWTFVADGRIDSPPTLHDGLCLFGTRNGFVYCLRTSDGALVWRFRAAPQDRRLFSYEQLESVWPVHGSVLVDEALSDGVATAYFSAGRSSGIDGGIRLYALEAKTGKVLHKADITTRGEEQGEATIQQKALPDILSIQKEAIWMRGLGVDKNLATVENVPHLFAPRGFLDDAWWNRTYWMYDTGMRWAYFGWRTVSNASPAGRLLAFDGSQFYGYGLMDRRDYFGDGGSHPGFQLQVQADATKDYMLVSEVASHVPADGTWEEWKRQIEWAAPLPFVAKSIVLTRDALLVAGGASLAETAESHGPGFLRVVARKDGSKKATSALSAPPVLDGMALTGAGIFVSTIDGSVTCLANKE